MTPAITPLLFEVTNGNLPEINRLIHQGADVNHPDAVGRRLLAVAITALATCLPVIASFRFCRKPEQTQP